MTTGRNHFLVGPSQQEEGHLGYDVELVGGFRAVLIQFKRAYVSGNRWTWRLNRTRRKDQHERLRVLESNGLQVYYAFPQYSTIQELRVIGWALPYWTHWFRPHQINPPGGPLGYHQVQLDAATGTWSVASRPVDIGQPEPFDTVISSVNESRVFESTSELQARLAGLTLTESLSRRGRRLRTPADTVRGQALIVQPLP
jgi:hypothetical protein